MHAQAAPAQVAAALTALFVPGNRPERFEKAAASGADIVIIDLEDAVAPEDKQDARRAAVSALTGSNALGGSGLNALVRVNAVDSPEHDADLQAMLEVASRDGHGLAGIVVPKAEDSEKLARLAARLPRGVALVALIESALGVVSAVELAQVPGVTRLAFGAVDYALDIDAGEGDRFLDPARAQLVAASRAAGIAAPLDSPSTDIRDARAVAGSAALGRGFGFGGKLCIHPTQLEYVDEAYRPSAAELDWAKRVIAVGGGAAQVDGKMVDRPVIDRARRILARSKNAVIEPPNIAAGITADAAAPH